MGTSNFYNENASKIYAMQLEDDLDYDFLVEDLTLLAMGKFKNDFETCDKYEENGLYSFPGNIIGRIYENFENENGNILVIVNIIIRSGYYSGVNLDYSIELNYENYNDRWEDMDLQDQEAFNCDDDFRKLKALTIYKKSIAWLEKNIKALEAIYQQIATPLSVIATFSNGETIYKSENQYIS